MTEGQGERVIVLLEQILGALIGVTDRPPCQHPEDERLNLGSMGEAEWICRACKYHYGPVKKEQSHAALSQ